MNKRQKEVIQAQLDSEKAVLKQLERNYQDALADINTKIEILLARQDADMQHVIYQLEYQRALRTQVQSILEQLQANEFETVSEYLANSYNDGFLGAMYDMHGQGVPLIVPIDQEAVLEAVQHETKLSESLYTSLGHDMTELRKNISAEITRGIATGLSYGAIARNIEGYARVPMNRAMTIARTEAHRIQCKAAYDAQHKAQENGADVVKQWDAALDNHTRDTHRQLDGQIQELDDPFKIGGLKAMYPGDFGDPAQDCNCRCSILQRARWNLGSDYTKWSADAPKLYADDGVSQLAHIEAKNYESFKRQYNQATERVRESARMMNDDVSREYRFINYNKGDYSVPERVSFMEAFVEMPEKVKQNLIDTDVIVGSEGSSFDPLTGTIYIGKNAGKYEAIHEIGHAMEHVLFDKDSVDALKQECVNGLGIFDIRTVSAYDSSGNIADIFILESDKFVSAYQGRLYVDNIADAINPDGSINIECMHEFISVGVQMYYEKPRLLRKKNNALYDMIGEVMHDEQ